MSVMRGLTAWLAGLMVVAGAAGAGAKPLYVNATTGNDTVSYESNGPAAPWRTIGRAAWGSTSPGTPNPRQAAQAGDVVMVAAGTYTTAGSGSRNRPAYRPANSGTRDAPIVFRAVGLVTLTLSGGAGPLIGALEQNYITWDGFTINEAGAPSLPDTGSVTLFGCTGCVLEHLDINGNGDANRREDNHNGIRIESSFDVIVRHNRIQNVYTAHNANNGAGIMTYDSAAMTLEHNEIFNCGSGIFLKGPATRLDFVSIRYNLIHHIGERRNGGAGMGVGSAIVLHRNSATTAERPLVIAQNIVHDVIGEAAVHFWRWSATDPRDTPMNVKVVNNTFHNVHHGLWVDADMLPNGGHVFRNNIVSQASMHAIAYDGQPDDRRRIEFDRNVYAGAAAFAHTNSGTQPLAGWRSTYKQDTGSIETDPQFVNAAAGDFHLRPTSKARTAGIDVLDLDGDGSTTDVVPAGAYVTGQETIGREAASGGQP